MIIYRKSKLNNFWFVSICAIAIMGLVGCSDPHYLAEKLFWQAKQNANKILRKYHNISHPKEIKDSDLEKIISGYRKVVERCPLEILSARSQFIIASFYLWQGKDKQAEKELRNITLNFSSKPEIASRAQFTIGKIYEKQKKWQQALKEYNKLLTLYPLTRIGLYLPIYIINYYKRIDNQQEEENAFCRAVKNYKKLINKYSQTSIEGEIKNYLALAYFTKGDYSQAIKIWDEIIADHPHTLLALNAYLKKAATYTQKIKNIPKAIEVYRQLLKDFPKLNKKIEKRVKFIIATLSMKSDLKEAERLFSSILKEYPDDQNLSLNAHLSLVQCYKKRKNSSGVIEEYKKIREKYPNHQISLAVPFLIAHYYFTINDKSKAERKLKEAILTYEQIFNQENEENKKAEAAKLLVSSYLLRKDWDKAIEILKILKNRYPQNPQYLLNIASIYKNGKKDFSKAAKAYQEVIKKFPSHKYLIKKVNAELKALNTSGEKKNNK